MADTTPSWMRGRGNHCETCVSWSKDKYIPYCGTCTSPSSMDSGEVTDSRYRCPSFERRQEEDGR
jgi:hypothetical protein